MGQLDVYSLEDISLVTILVGPMSTYFSEEIEASIESIVAYIYSTNLATRKRTKLLRILRPAGDIAGAMYYSWTYLKLSTEKFRAITKPLDERIMWQDPILSQWEGAAHRKNMEKLDNKYSW